MKRAKDFKSNQMVWKTSGYQWIINLRRRAEIDIIGIQHHVD